MEHNFTLLFGKDQKNLIDSILSNPKLTPHITNHNCKVSGELIQYNIVFNKEYGIYLFGYFQGINKNSNI